MMLVCSRTSILVQLLVLATLVEVHALSQPINRKNSHGRRFLATTTSKSGSWNLAAALLCGTLIFGSPVSAATPDPANGAATFGPQVYTNDYADPLHPYCERHVRVDADGKTFRYTGTGVGARDDTVLRGCSPKEKKEFGLRQGTFNGAITAEGRLDAGDGIHDGVWEPKQKMDAMAMEYSDADGIRWNDGNKWVVQDQAVVRLKDQKYQVQTKGAGFQFGQAIVFAYVGLSGLAGVKGVVDTAKRNSNE